MGLNQRTGFTLPPSGTIIFPFEKGAAVTSLPVFCASPGQADVLANLIGFLEDESYQWISRACPTTGQQGNSNQILANQTFEDQISVPAGSFLTMIGGICMDNSTNLPSTYGFRVFLYDAGAQAAICDGFMNGACISGYFDPLPQTSNGMIPLKNQPASVNGTQAYQFPVTGQRSTFNKNLFILPSPLTITSPGQLNVSVVNLGPNTVTLDMAFYFAAPVGAQGVVDPAWIGNVVGR